MADGCVCLLHRVHPETDRFEEDWKLIGVDDTECVARQGRSRVEDRPGLRDRAESFMVVTHRLKRESRVEGCIRMG